MKAKRQTTKVIYRKENSLGTQYAPRNCSGYGTKWRITLRRNYYNDWIQVGLPILLEENWTINEDKIEDSNWFLYEFLTS